MIFIHMSDKKAFTGYAQDRAGRLIKRPFFPQDKQTVKIESGYARSDDQRIGNTSRSGFRHPVQPRIKQQISTDQSE